MKKNILLYGSSRSGKTTLARLLNEKLNYNIVSIDSLVSAFSRAMPQLEINHNNNDGSVVENVKMFLWEYIKTMNKENNKKRDLFYCVEGAYYNINDLYKNKDKFIVIILIEDLDGPEQYFRQMRKFDKEYDWTYKLSDNELMEYAKNLDNDNKRIVNFCKNFGMKYYDTSKSREEVFNQILIDIEKEIKENEHECIEQVVLKYGELRVGLKSPAYLIDTIVKRYKGMMTVSEKEDNCDYMVEFCEQFKCFPDADLYTFNIPHLDCFPQFSIDNDNRCSKVYFLNNYEREIKKRIARNFITCLFTRLYQLKGSLLLHCAAIEKNGKAVIIVGKANSGKTVTMLNLLNYGFNFITNDFLIIDKNNNKLQFLPSAQFIGIRRTREWLKIKRNRKYRLLKTEGYTNVTKDRIYIRPQDLTTMNNVEIGNEFAVLKLVVIPQYVQDQVFCAETVSVTNLQKVLCENTFKNFIDYSNKENYDNDLYKINIKIRNTNNTNQIFEEILNKHAYILKQNENNIEQAGRFIDLQLEG